MTDMPTEAWDGVMGERWLAMLDQFEGMIAPIGIALLAGADFHPGQSVIDIGCGAGATSIDIARLVGPTGRVTGLDIAPMLIAKARERLDETLIDTVEFVVADAQTTTPEAAPVDRLFSRFGVMFFEDSAAAFANMRGWLAPGGQIDFACWQAPDRNPWIGMAAQIVGQHIQLPERDLDGPGPFRFADPDRTRAMLEGAGFHDVVINPWTGDQPLAGEGSTPESATDFIMTTLDVSARLAEQDPDLPARVRAEIATALARYQRDGAVRLPGAAWFVTARA